ncbi:host specificity factor TipJ family phage tail protein [Massilia sp. CT11-137]|uniref:host specificity factor TipJ family phage tail protein n=1 Tax=Massilia sp. CT11-137 TaxID=3393901 RepID=UPI0039A46684
MIRIRLYDSPFAPAAPRVFEVPSLAEWLLDHYGPAPDVTVQIFRGEPCAETEISRDVRAILAGDCAEYVVLQSPGAQYYAVIAIVSAIIAVAAIVLMPKPVMPSNVNRTQQSPNNALGNRENKVRLLERVEDIYGTVKSIPSLMMPTYNKYIQHSKFEYGYYCVGRGYYDIDEVRDGDTLIADIDGASAAFYAPFTSPNSGTPMLQIGAPIGDGVVTAKRAIEVDGITLKAVNQVQLPASAKYRYTPAAGGDTITQIDKKPNFNSVIDVGDQITVVMAGFNKTTYAGLDYDGSKVDETVVAGPYNYSGTYTVAAVDDGVITLTTASWPAEKEVDSAITIVGATYVTDWVTLPEADRTEVWCNVVAQNGMFKDDNGKLITAVGFTIEIERLAADLTPTGAVETITASLSGAVQDERAETVEHVTGWTGPARVRMYRTTPFDFDFKGTVVDEIKWTDLYSVSPVSKAEFGNKTTVHTVTQATARATAVKTRQLNCLASRKLPIYNGVSFSGVLGDDGRLVSGTIAATSRLVDIIAAVSIDPKIGRRDLASEVDMKQIWDVQQALDAWNPECGQFNYTFDTDNTSFEEAVVMIANAGFCIAYRQNGKIRLAFDQAQANSTALFTHRNKKPKAETITRTFASDSDYDGVEFVYADPDTGQSETITLPLDGSHTKAKKFEIAGIRSFAQAWLRANREYRKLLGQRITIETTTTTDARSLLPNARIDIVDNTRFKSYDGEVVGQDGLTLTLSGDVAFVPGQPHSIVLMRRDGSLQSIACRASAEPNQVILQALPSEEIVTSYGSDGIRTIYSFAADSARGAQAYLVQEMDLSDPQYVTIRAINYSADYYAADHAAMPDKSEIIN